ncbi:hypothetical protein P8C59_003253 [Phyllachora maydis]|uniref:Retrovirus-related Pol polyprotein from transposon TNT 1-94-like beta-barrel domain-containing protein n=1 Tax=Phyllachora maydis TaxID=1825666 RepID=A0AAD9I033_9PEZI|nr:hypothetical protein P8C59_003253 [Phyllachora maydis]
MLRGHRDQHLTPLTAINKIKESRNPAIEAYRVAYIANSSNSTPNSNSNPSKKGSYNLAIEEEEESNSSSDSSSSSDSNTQLAQLLALKGCKKRKDFKGKGLKTSSNNKAKYKDNQPRRHPRDPALYNSWLYNTGSTDHINNSKERFTTFTPNIGHLRPINTGNGPVSPASIGSIILEVLSRKAPPTYTKLVLDNVLYLPNIDINIVNVKDSSKPILHTHFAFPLGLTSYNTTKSKELQRNKIVVEIPSNSIRKEDYGPIIEGAIVSEAIEPKKRYKLRNSPAKGTTLEGIGPSLRRKRPCRPTREPKPLTGTGDLPYMLRELVIEGNKVEKAISSPTLKEPNIGQRDYYNLLNLAKLTEECKLLAVLGSKTYLVYIPSKRAVLKTSTIKFIEDNTVLNPSNLNTEKPISIEIGPSKLEPYKSSSNSKLDKPLLDKPINPVIVESTRPTISIRKPKLPEAFPQTIEPIFTPKPIEVIAPNQPITNEPLDNSNLILEGDKKQLNYYKLLAKTSSYILFFIHKARKRVISKDSTPTTYKQVIKLPRDKRRVFYNAKTCHFIVTYIDDCLFIGPDIGYITDLKKRLNKWLSRSLNRPIKSHLNAAKNLFKYLNSTKDYSICFSHNGNSVADLGPKLSNSSNTTTKLSKDFHSKEGPRPLTTTSTTIVDSGNGKGSSRTSIINSSLVPLGFSNSDFTGDKATCKSTYGYLYKSAIQWIIGLFSELYRPIDYPITLYGDNQGSIMVANNPALYARTKHTLLKFRYVREQVKAKIVTIIYLNTKSTLYPYIYILYY